jgi:hypothetical protein
MSVYELLLSWEGLLVVLYELQVKYESFSVVWLSGTYTSSRLLRHYFGTRASSKASSMVMLVSAQLRLPMYQTFLRGCSERSLLWLRVSMTTWDFSVSV